MEKTTSVRIAYHTHKGRQMVYKKAFVKAIRADRFYEEANALSSCDADFAGAYEPYSKRGCARIPVVLAQKLADHIGEAITFYLPQTKDKNN